MHGDRGAAGEGGSAPKRPPRSPAAALAGWAEEKQSSFLYRAVAEAEAGTPRERLFRGLAEEAERQAAIWAQRARDAGSAPPLGHRPTPRARLVAALVRRIGPRAMRPVLAAMKVRGLSIYGAAPPEAAHTRAAEERRHRGVEAGGNLRAAVFGVNDGLVSNASLIFGVAGATGDPALVLLSGVAGLLAGAFSMAAGEYVSVRSQREMYEFQIDLERAELEEYPEEEAEELALIYRERGLPREEAGRLAEAIIADPERALDTLAREELGLAPEQLSSPWGAASFSFAAFAIGAALPLLPFLLGAGRAALPVAIALTATALFGVGAAISLFTGRGAWRGGLRMLAIGGTAGLLTYAIGTLLGVGVG